MSEQNSKGRKEVTTLGQVILGRGHSKSKGSKSPTCFLMDLKMDKKASLVTEDGPGG